MRLVAAYKLVRPLNLLIVILATFVSFVISGFCGDPAKFLSFVTPLILLAAFSNSLNDCLDAELDFEAHPSRPIPRGEISIRESRLFTIVLGVLTLGSAFLYRGNITKVIFVAGFFLAVLYDFYLKKIVFFGNFAVSILTSFPFLLMGLEISNFRILWFPVSCSILYNLVRESLKDMEDFKVDQRFGYRTLPFYIGEKGIRIFGVLLLAVMVILTFVAFLSVFHNPIFLISMLVILVYLAFKVLRERSFSRLSVFFKTFMIFVLLAILVGGTL